MPPTDRRFPHSRRWLLLGLGLIGLLIVLILSSGIRLFPALSGPDAGTLHVDGDFILTGDHDGDLVVIAASVLLPDTAVVTGSAGIVGGAVTIGGRVDGDLTVLAEHVLIEAGATISGETAIMAETVLYEGTSSGSVTITAPIVTLGASARAAGPVMACADTLTDQADGLQRVPCTDRDQVAAFDWLIRLRDNAPAVIGAAAIGGPGAALSGGMTALLLTALAALTVTIFPARTARIALALRERPGRFWGAGLAGAVVTGGALVGFIVIAAVFPPLTLLLIPLCFSALLAGLVLAIAGMAAVAQVTGERVLVRNAPPPVLAAAVGGGLIALGVLALMLISPLLAGGLLLALAALGIGAAAFTRLGSRATGSSVIVYDDSPAV